MRVRLPFGAWWLAEKDFCSREILRNRFEIAERRFVENFLQPGMTVLDIGAHHGFYSLLASAKVGAQGRVIAFEPSPREREKLVCHLVLNGCTNVQVEPCALDEREGEAELTVVGGGNTGCNSLRPPLVSEPVEAVPVPVTNLDTYLSRQEMQPVDFIKLDVEGAELGVLKGARALLARRPRPVILCELQEIRARPWGYHPREVVRLLADSGYRWFLPLPEGKLQAVPPGQMDLEGNFVAVPQERIEPICAQGLVA